MDGYEDDNKRFLRLKGRETTKSGKGALLNLTMRKRKYGTKKLTFYLATT